jgi:hypothetical protein
MLYAINMRTTMTIDDDLADSIERLRDRENLSFRAAVEQLLRAGLRATESKPKSRPYCGKTFNMGLQQGIDPNRFNQLVDELDVEEYKG